MAISFGAGFAQHTPGTLGKRDGSRLLMVRGVARQGVAAAEIRLRTLCCRSFELGIGLVARPRSPGRKPGRGSGPRGRNAGPGCDGTLRIATSRLDLSAELIGAIYRQRWLIEELEARIAPYSLPA